MTDGDRKREAEMDLVLIVFGGILLFPLLIRLFFITIGIILPVIMIPYLIARLFFPI